MAKTGKLTTNKYDSTRYYELVWEITEQDNNANQSTIKWTLYARGGGSGWYAERTLKVVIAETTVINKTDRVQRRAGEVASGTIPVTHNADGTKAISASIKAAVYGTSLNCTASGNWDLDPIARGAYITAAPDFTDEQSPTIQYSNPFGNDVTSLEACISFTGANDDVPYREISKTGTSYTFELTPEELLTLQKGVTSGNTVKVAFYLRTRINGETYWNNVVKTFTLTGDLKPTMITWAQDENPVTSLLVGPNNFTVIAGQSDLAYEFEAEPKKGATIVSYSVKCGSYTSSSRNGVIKGIVPGDDNTIYCIATDSRGNTVESTIPLTTIHYGEPEGYYEPDSLSTSSGNIYFNVRCYWFHGWFDGTNDGSKGGVENVPVVQYRYRTRDGEYGQWFDSTDFFQDEWDDDYCKVTITGLDYTIPYLVQIRLVDELVKGDAAPVSEEYTINMVPVFDWSREDFKVNAPLYVQDGIHLVDCEGEYVEAMKYKISERGIPEGLDIGFANFDKADSEDEWQYNTTLYGNNIHLTTMNNLYINYLPMVDFITEQGTEPMGSNGTWYWTKWASGKAECYGVRNYGNMAITEVWGSDFSSEDFNQELPDIFAEPPYVMDISMYGSDKFAWIAKKDVPTTTKSGIFIVVRPASGTLSQAHISFHAIGSW